MITRGQRFEILIFRPKGPTRLLRVIPRAIAAYRESVADPAQGNDKAGVDAGDLTASQLCLFMPVGTYFFFSVAGLTMSIIDRYRGPNDVVVAPIMKAATDTQRGRVMCQYRSPVLSACQALRSETIKQSAYGGVVRSNDVTLS